MKTKTITQSREYSEWEPGDKVRIYRDTVNRKAKLEIGSVHTVVKYYGPLSIDCGGTVFLDLLVGTDCEYALGEDVVPADDPDYFHLANTKAEMP